MSTCEVTFQNNTDDEITFRHEFKHVTGREFSVGSRQVHVEKVTVRQTHEAFCLLDSERKKITGKEFNTDDVPRFAGVVVTKEGDEYILTKVESPTLWTTVQNTFHQIRKRFSQDAETLPTSQTNSGRRRM